MYNVVLFLRKYWNVILTTYNLMFSDYKLKKIISWSSNPAVSYTTCRKWVMKSNEINVISACQWLVKFNSMWFDSLSWEIILLSIPKLVCVWPYPVVSHRIWVIQAGYVAYRMLGNKQHVTWLFILSLFSAK